MKAWNLSEKNSEKQIGQGNKTSFFGLEIRYALIYTSINSLSANIPTELLVTLLETKKWTATKVFIYAQKEPNLHKRVTKLISIHQIIKDKSIKKEEVIEKALEIVSNIQGDYYRASTLSSIVPHLDGPRKEEIIEETLEIVSNIQDDNYSAYALSGIVPHLDGPRKDQLMERALEIVSNIQDDYSRAYTLSGIVPHLDGPRKEEIIEETLEIASNIQDDSRRAGAHFFALSHMRNSSAKKLYFCWRRSIQNLKENTRSNLLSNMIVLIPVINDLGKDETLFEISQAIIDVSRWWP